MTLQIKKNLNIIEALALFNTKIYVFRDANDKLSYMRYIPPFSACRALDSTTAPVTPSGTVGDWFHPRDIQSAWYRSSLTSGALVGGESSVVVSIQRGWPSSGSGIIRDTTNDSDVLSWTGITYGSTTMTLTGVTGVLAHNNNALIYPNSGAYEIVTMGNYFVDLYLCSSNDATLISMGTVASGVYGCYVSQPFVCPRVSQSIEHYRQFLSKRFNNYPCGFIELPELNNTWSGKGGLITDQHWVELWVWTRINRWLLHGNDYGNSEVAAYAPSWYKGNITHASSYSYWASEYGITDLVQYGLGNKGFSVTGACIETWNLPVNDFLGNRWEFTEGLRLSGNVIYTAGKTINPYTGTTYNESCTAGGSPFVNTSLTVSGITAGQYLTNSYRTEKELSRYCFPGSTTTSNSLFDDGLFDWTNTGEQVARRGGDATSGGTGCGALKLNTLSSWTGYYVGARAVCTF